MENFFEEYLDNLPVNDYSEPFSFQHDGAPSHTRKAVTHFLVWTFGNSYIGNRGTVHLPARSTDLTLCDFYLWDKIPLSKSDLKTEAIWEMLCMIHLVVFEILQQGLQQNVVDCVWEQMEDSLKIW